MGCNEGTMMITSGLPMRSETLELQLFEITIGILKNGVWSLIIYAKERIKLEIAQKFT